MVWMSRRSFVGAIPFIGTCLPTHARAEAATSSATTLFQNVRIFDGKGGALTTPSNVLIKGNVIERISTAPIAAEPGTTIAGGGRTLMPGLIDNHWHAFLVRPTPLQAMGDFAFNTLAAGDEATDTLMRGFTTVRDVGGPVFGLKRAIDAGIVKGPRIYPSGAMITVTSGHGDFRQFSDLPRTIGGMLTRMEQIGGSIVADSPDEVRMRVREQLMQGASQIKLTAGGGVSSPHSPIDVTTFSEAELRAAVEATENWGTYVVAHAFIPTAIQRAIAAGVKCIEHGFLMDEATAKLIAEKGAWLSLQPLPEEMRTNLPVGSVERAKAEEVWPGIGRTYEFAKKYKIKTAWGTDVLFSRALAQRQEQFWRRLSAGTRPPRRLPWRPRRMPNCWRCPASAIPIRESSASSSKAHWQTCCLSTEIRSITST
jgi:imidazolonepropionase-like amidohydrolase